MNEFLLYTDINNDTAASFIQQMNWVSPDSMFCVRMYCPGGDVQAGWGMWAKINELRSKGCRAIAKVDGMAASMGGILLCAFDEREALETSQLMIHRAVNAVMVDEDGKVIEPNEQEVKNCQLINNDLKSRLLSIIDDKKLKNIKGYGIDDIFDEKQERINCFLTAKEAETIGLITKINPLDSANTQNLTKANALYTANYKLNINTNTATVAITATKKAKTMTAAEFKEKFPDEFKKLQDEFKKEASKKAKLKASKEPDGDEDEDEDDDFDKETKAKLAKLQAKCDEVDADEDEDEDDKKEKKAKLKAKMKGIKDSFKETKKTAFAVNAVLAHLGISKIEASQNPQIATNVKSTTVVVADSELAKITADIEAIKSGKYKS